MTVNEELIARRNIIVKAMVDLYDATKMIGGPDFGQYADAIIAALESRPAPTEERVSPVDAFEMGYEFAYAASRPQSQEDSRAVGRLLWSDTLAPLHQRIKAIIDRDGFNSFSDAESGRIACKHIIHEALATETQPVAGGEQIIREAAEDLVAMLTDRLQLEGPGKLSLIKEVEKHFARFSKPTTPERAKAMEQALRFISEGNLGDGPGQANYARIKQFAANALSASPPEVVEQ